MLSRFFSNMSVLVLAGALVTLSLVLAPRVVTWVGVGVGSGVVAMTAIAFLARDRGSVQRALDAPIAILGGWTIVGSRLFSGHTVRWLSFGEAVLLVGLAIAGLIAHEALNERAIRRLAENPVVNAGEILVDRRRVALTDSHGS